MLSTTRSKHENSAAGVSVAQLNSEPGGHRVVAGTKQPTRRVLTGCHAQLNSVAFANTYVLDVRTGNTGWLRAHFLLHADSNAFPITGIVSLMSFKECAILKHHGEFSVQKTLWLRIM